MKKFLIGLGIFALVIIALIVVGGGFSFIEANKDAPSIEAFVDKFYKAYNSQDINHIYNDLSDPKLKETIKFEEFEKVLKGTYKKLGAVKSREKVDWSILTSADGVSFDVQYKVKRGKFESVDNFSLNKKNDSWLLYGYHANSNNLF